MRKFCSLALLAALLCPWTALAVDTDSEAAAALALALASQRTPVAPDVKAKVCRCSLTGVCTCSPGDDCGCVSGQQYRWVETSKPGHVALYRGAVQVGNWRTEEGAFYLLVDDGGDAYHWTKATCPVDAPTRQTTAPRATPVQYAPQRLSYMPVMEQFRPSMIDPGQGGTRAVPCRS